MVGSPTNTPIPIKQPVAVVSGQDKNELLESKPVEYTKKLDESRLDPASSPDPSGIGVDTKADQPNMACHLTSVGSAPESSPAKFDRKVVNFAQLPTTDTVAKQDNLSKEDSDYIEKAFGGQSHEPSRASHKRRRASIFRSFKDVSDDVQSDRHKRPATIAKVDDQSGGDYSEGKSSAKKSLPERHD